jgi:hypothetical protein
MADSPHGRFAVTSVPFAFTKGLCTDFAPPSVETTISTPNDWESEEVWIIFLAVGFFGCNGNPKGYTEY